jgi:NAD(P)H-hydrate epimerase
MTFGCKSEQGHFARAAVPAILKKCEWASVLAVGPGLGRHNSLQEMICQLYAELPQPMIVDADALNILADVGADLAQHRGPRVLTPHPGEFCRMIKKQIEDRQKLEDQAIRMAESASVITVLKGYRTLVTDGATPYHNETGNPGMATAGCGDVLTGMIASLIGQGLTPLEAAEWGCYLHGMAGDLAAEDKGQVSMIATDIIEYLPKAITACSNVKHGPGNYGW